MVTPFDAQLRVDEEATVALMEHLVAHGSDGARGLRHDRRGVDARPTRSTCALIELAVAELRGRRDDRRRRRLQRHAPRGPPDRARDRARRRRAAARHALLQPPEPARDRRATSRRARRPPTSRSCSTTSRSRTGRDMPNELLAELAQQIDNVVAVKQANADSLAPIDGLDALRRRRRRRFCDDAGDGRRRRHAASPATSSATRCAAWSTSPSSRARDRRRPARRATRRSRSTPNPIGIKAALNLLGHGVGGLRLPMVEADEQELAVIRARARAARPAGDGS